MLSPTYEITTALSHTDELISPPYDIAIVTISYGRVTMSSVWDSMMSKKIWGGLSTPPYFCDIARCFNTINVLQNPDIPLSERRWGMGVSFASNILPQSPPLSSQLQQISIYFIDTESMRRVTNCVLKICGKLLLIHSPICHDKPFLSESYSNRCYDTVDEHSQSHACFVCYKMSNV